MTHHKPTPLPYHPKPVVGNGLGNIGVRTGAGTFIPGRSSVVSGGRNPALAAHVGLLGVQLRSTPHTQGSEATRAHLHAQAIIAELQKELAAQASIGTRSGRLPILRKQLDHDLEVIETHRSAAAAENGV